MQHVEFWGINRVMEVVGISKSLIYREMREGRFPQNRGYREHASRRFWLSHEIKAWQQAQIDEHIAELHEGLPQVEDFDVLLDLSSKS